MLLQPKKPRYKKSQKGFVPNLYSITSYRRELAIDRTVLAEKVNSSKKYRIISFQPYQLQLIASESGRISAVQIEAARVALNRKLKSKNITSNVVKGTPPQDLIRTNSTSRKIVRVFPNVAVTQKPSQVRMGQGKGLVARWICRIKPQAVLFCAPASSNGRAGLSAASHKLPIKTKIVSAMI